jgi:hypothetical protein
MEEGETSTGAKRLVLGRDGGKKVAKEIYVKANVYGSSPLPPSSLDYGGQAP